MLDFMIELPGKEGTFKHPITITEKDLLISLLEKKGKAIDLIKSLLIELKKDESDIIKIKLREIGFIDVEEVLKKFVEDFNTNEGVAPPSFTDVYLFITGQLRAY